LEKNALSAFLKVAVEVEWTINIIVKRIVKFMFLVEKKNWCYYTVCTSQIGASTLPSPTRAYPKYLTLFPAQEGGNLIILVFPGEVYLITTHRGWWIWLLALISCYISHWFHNFGFNLINHGGVKHLNLMNSKEKIADCLKAYPSFVQYLILLRTILYYLWMYKYI